MAYIDSDGTIDFNITDHFGKPWFMFRGREGLGGVSRSNNEFDECRGTGVLRPPAFPKSLYMEYPPFMASVLEGDVLAGRRGVLGWDGLDCDDTLLLSGKIPPAPEWEEPSALVRWVAGWSDTDTFLIALGGAVAITGLIVAGVCAAPIVIPALATTTKVGIVTAGVGFATTGYAEASIHNPDASWALSYDNARIANVVGNTLIAGGAAMALAPAAAWIAGAIPFSGLAMAGYGAYTIGSQVVDIASNWDNMDAIDVAGRVLPMAAAFAGGWMARGAIRTNYARGLQTRAAIGRRIASWQALRGGQGVAAQRAIANRVMTRAQWETYYRGVRIARNDLTPVSRWGRPALQPGDWVMKGQKSWSTYIRSFKWDFISPTNQVASYSSGATYYVPRSYVHWPSGWGIDGAWKGLFGQRIYLP